MTPRFTGILLQIFFIISCGRSTPAAPPKLPKAAAGGASTAEVALVWVRPIRDQEYELKSNEGFWEEPVPVKTFWVTPTGTGWEVAAQRPGLFWSPGAAVSEVRLACYHHRLDGLPAPSEQEHEQLKDCRELMDGNAELGGLTAKGNGLKLRDLSSDSVQELIAPARSLTELDFPYESFRYAKPLGSLGPYLFVQISGFHHPCGMRGMDADDFEILDLAKGVRVTPMFSVNDPGGAGPWKKYFDLPEGRVELAPMIKKQLREYDATTAEEYDPVNLYVRHFHPVFPEGMARVVFQVAYRYWAGCRACPQFDGYSLAEELPPEMTDHTPMHPAVAAARAALPKDWRIGGLSLFSSTPAETTRLRHTFESR